MKIESNKTNKSKLASALKRRFGSPSAVLRALGLDESLVDVGNTAQPDVDGTKAQWAEFKQKLSVFLHEQRHTVPEEDGGGLVGKILALIDDDGAQDVGPDVEGFRKLLRDKGWSDADIAEAIRLAGGEPVADRLPLDATRGGFGGFGRGSEADRVGGPAMDSAVRARAEDGLDQMGFAARRISIGLDYGGLRVPRPVSTPAPDARQTAEFAAMYPMAARFDV